MKIKKIVNNLVSECGTNDPFEIAERKNIKVIEFDLHPDILGFYRYVRRNMLIYLNSCLDYHDKRFTCSHELGHSQIHPRMNTPFLKRKTYFSHDKIEVEANRFAVELLMPDEHLQGLRYESLTIQEAATMYGVPLEVAHLKKFNH